ncbi:plastocyanin/azurin family copper-binding protein [Salinisphaera sp. LB1]|uniref:plastocyanin/azurin family copper-binding protein n=1 Tax=Salinisphaera sp. LB1 TaxID=2183911 RepID=UPI000D70572E|nr:plastocyanin/azurin family copper-binding protein [Salinisphaera sp. LB1]AWN14710.1 Azurin [Salinisphaera sp. LB1]
MFRRLIAASVLLLVATAVFAAPTKSVTIVGRNDLRFSQDHITVAPGTKVTLKLINKSHLPASAMSHNWVLLKSGTDAGAFDNAARSAANNDYIPKSMSDRVIAHTTMVSGGHSDTITFTAPTKPGNYEYICTFPGHFRAGMKGTLTVSPTN